MNDFLLTPATKEQASFGEASQVNTYLVAISFLMTPVFPFESHLSNLDAESSHQRQEVWKPLSRIGEAHIKAIPSTIFRSTPSNVAVRIHKAGDEFSLYNVPVKHGQLCFSATGTFQLPGQFAIRKAKTPKMIMAGQRKNIARMASDFMMKVCDRVKNIAVLHHECHPCSATCSIKSAVAHVYASDIRDHRT